MKTEDCKFLKQLGLIQPPIESNFEGQYHVLYQLRPEVWTSAVLAENMVRSPEAWFINNHDLEIIAYEPSLKEFWSFLTQKLPLYMAEPSLVLIYNWEKKVYELASGAFNTVISAPEQKDALFMFFTLSLFHGKDGVG